MGWVHLEDKLEEVAGWAALGLGLAPAVIVSVPVVGKRYLTNREHRATP